MVSAASNWIHEARHQPKKSINTFVFAYSTTSFGTSINTWVAVLPTLKDWLESQRSQINWFSMIHRADAKRRQETNKIGNWPNVLAWIESFLLVFTWCLQMQIFADLVLCSAKSDELAHSLKFPLSAHYVHLACSEHCPPCDRWGWDAVEREVN